MIPPKTDQPTKEFKVGDLGNVVNYEALVAHVAKMTLPNEKIDDIKADFKYRLEEKHAARWVVFDSTEGFGYAIASSEDKGYVFLSACIYKMGSPPPAIKPTPVSPGPKTKMSVEKKVKSTKFKASSTTTPKTSKKGKGSVEEKILGALKELLEIGITEPPRKQVALFAGYSNVASKGFANALSKLSKTNLYIEYPDSKTVRLTAAGTVAAGSVSPPRSNAEVQEKIMTLLKPKEIDIFNLLIDGDAHDRKDIATSANYSNVASKGFANALSKLSTLEILEYPKDPNDSKKKLVRLTQLAFPFGRPNEFADL